MIQSSRSFYVIPAKAGIQAGRGWGEHSHADAVLTSAGEKIQAKWGWGEHSHVIH